MKDVMSRQGPQGVFGYLGPQEQVVRAQGILIPADDIPSLKKHLEGRFAGRIIAFEKLRDECSDDDELRDPEYRSALKELRDEGRVSVSPVTSKTDKGLGGNDRITFL